MLTAAEEKLAEIARLIREREQAQHVVSTIDARIVSLATGAADKTQRKPRSKTVSARDFARGCGV